MVLEYFATFFAKNIERERHQAVPFHFSPSFCLKNSLYFQLHFYSNGIFYINTKNKATERLPCFFFFMPTSIQGRTVEAGIAANLITKAIPSNADVLLVVFPYHEKLSGATQPISKITAIVYFAITNSTKSAHPFYLHL